MIREKKSVTRNLFLKQDYFFLTVFLVTGCFVFWKCRYGFGHIDESFYLTVPYRLLQGDALFQEEWHLSQMAGVLTMPLVSAVLLLKGSTEGIILTMRYICTTVQCAVAMFLYVRLKRINWLGAAAAAICFLLYTPFGIMALSYNSMGILFLVASQVILFTAQRRKELQYYLAGSLFAAAVLCCPYLLLVYAGYLLTVAVRAFSLRIQGRSNHDSVWSIKSAVYITGGAATAAVLFAVFVLSRASLWKIVQSFPPMLNDPEHLPSPRFAKLTTYFTSIINANQYTPYLYAGLSVLWLICLVDKKRKKRKVMYTFVVCALIVCLMLSHYCGNHYINTLMWSVNIFALFLVLLSENPQVRSIFYIVCVPGLLYSYCLHLSSNQCFLAISSASTVASVGSLTIVGQYVSELCLEDVKASVKKLVVGVVVAVMVLQVSTQTFMRYESVFWDANMNEITMKVTDGIEKGIVTSETLYYNYYDCLKILDEVREYQGDKVLFLSENTWYYLYSEKEMATYSAWLSGVNKYTLDRLDTYYGINPHKLPDVVYADSIYHEIAEAFCQRFSYRMEPLERGYVLLPA